LSLNGRNQKLMGAAGLQVDIKETLLWSWCNRICGCSWVGQNVWCLMPLMNNVLCHSRWQICQNCQNFNKHCTDMKRAVFVHSLIGQSVHWCQISV
jgi:hypothetical protein